MLCEGLSCCTRIILDEIQRGGDHVSARVAGVVLPRLLWGREIGLPDIVFSLMREYGCALNGIICMSSAHNEILSALGVLDFLSKHVGSIVEHAAVAGDRLYGGKVMLKLQRRHDYYIADLDVKYGVTLYDKRAVAKLVEAAGLNRVFTADDDSAASTGVMLRLDNVIVLADRVQDFVRAILGSGAILKCNILLDGCSGNVENIDLSIDNDFVKNHVVVSLHYKSGRVRRIEFLFMVERVEQRSDVMLPIYTLRVESGSKGYVAQIRQVIPKMVYSVALRGSAQLCIQC